jgi:hypothetical protein
MVGLANISNGYSKVDVKVMVPIPDFLNLKSFQNLTLYFQPGK